MTLRNYSSTAAAATLSSGVDASTTTLTVSATTGFPATPFVLAIDAGAAAQELVLVTNVAGTTLTVTRAFDSTVASAHSTGASVVHSHAAVDFREANVHVNATSGVHGATGSVVGTSSTQTLANKTVALGNNTLSGTKAQFNAAMTDGDFATLDGTETLTNKTLTSPVISDTAGIGGAWSAHAPTVTAETGTITTVGGSTRYTQIGKTVHFHTVITIVAAGTGAGAVKFTLPVTPQASVQVVGMGREVGFTAMLVAHYASGVANASRFDGTTAIRNGVVIIAGTYEAA